MVQSDSLSRRPDLCPEEDHDNENKVLLPEGLFINLINTKLQQRIAKSDKYDMNAANTIKILLEKVPRELNSKLNEWTTEQFEGKNILFYQGRNYIPNDLELRKHIVHKYHDTITAGHPGELETFNAVRRHYWWPGMCIFVKKNYIKRCGKCQQFKINTTPTNSAFLPIQSAKSNRPFANCSMDMITDLPIIDGYDSILSLVDHGLTKGVIFIPCSKTFTRKCIPTIPLRQRTTIRR